MVTCFLYTGSFKPKSCYWPLTWNGRFQKPAELHSRAGKTEKDMFKHNTILHTLQLSMKIKETPRAFTAVGVLTTHYENNQNKNTTIWPLKNNCELSINRTQDSDQAILD